MGQRQAKAPHNHDHSEFLARRAPPAARRCYPRDSTRSSHSMPRADSDRGTAQGPPTSGRHRAVARPAHGRPYPASSRGGGFGAAPIASALNDLASPPRGLRELWPGERGRLPVLPPLRCAVLDCGAGARVAKDSDRAVLRSDRLDCSRRVQGSGGSAGAAGAVLRADEGNCRVATAARWRSSSETP